MSNPNVAAEAATVKTYAEIQHTGVRLKAATLRTGTHSRHQGKFEWAQAQRRARRRAIPPCWSICAWRSQPIWSKTFGPIFPLNAELKDPWCPNGHQDATADQKQIERWVREKPNCNWGGCINSVVDVDTSEAHGKDGLGNWLILLMENNDGNEPETLRLKTPTGGLHYPLTTKHPKKDLRPGVELPNYIVMPGSVTSPPTARA